MVPPYLSLYLAPQIRIGRVLLLLLVCRTQLLCLAARLTVECVAALGTSRLPWYLLAQNTVQLWRQWVDEVRIGETVRIDNGRVYDYLFLLYEV